MEAQPTLNQLCENLENIQQIIAEKTNHIGIRNIALVTGPTGAGKTIFSIYMANNNNVYVKGNDYEEYLALKDETELPHTTIPEFYINNDNKSTAFIDTPGSNDIKGADQEIENSFSIHCMLKNINFDLINTKIFCLISDSDFRSVSGKIFKENFDYLIKMFQNFYEIRNQIALIITKCENRNIARGLICKMRDMKIHPEFCEFFLANFEKNVFVFPKASNNDIGQVYPIFDDYAKILNFIRSPSQHIIRHNIALTSDAENKLLLIKDAQKTKCQDNITDLFEKIKNIFIQRLNPRTLSKWKNNLETISKFDNNKNINDILTILRKDYINEDIDEKSGLNDIFSSLEKSQKLNDFISDALRDKAIEIKPFIRDKMIDTIKSLLPDLIRNYKMKIVVESTATAGCVTLVGYSAKKIREHK